MALPLVQKINLVPVQTDAVEAADEAIMNDVSETNLVNYTKRVRFDAIKLFVSAQLADGIVVNSKIGTGEVTLPKMAANSVDSDQYVDGSIDPVHLADRAVPQTKLGAIKRMIMVPVFWFEDLVTVKDFTRIMAWHPDLAGHVVIGAWAALLGHESTSGAVTMNLINAGGTMAAISIGANAWSAQSGAISSSYDDVSSLATFSVNVTGAGVGARGLMVHLTVLG